MSNPAPVKLKLKIGGAAFSATSPSVGTPTPSATPKIRFGPSKPSTPAEPLPTPTTKTGRTPKPSAKAVANKNGKRKGVDSDEEDGGTVYYKMKSTVNVQPAQKKLKLSIGGPKTPKTPKTPLVKMKVKGRPPKRPLGDGYDSEASDRELDPVIEEEFVLRMIPGSDCEYLRQMISEKRIGMSRHQGGADVQMKFLHPEGRRALVTVRGTHYAATMVDLPTIVEGMKSWDKKGWYKSADICQMLWVFKKISVEAEAGTIDLPKEIDRATHQYPHGLTAPMYDARKRRFRKRISRTAIEAVEDAVEKLLEADARAESTKYEMLDPEGSRQGSRAYSTTSPGALFGEEYSENEDDDAEGEEDDATDYFGHISINGHAHGHTHVQPDIRELEDDMTADLEADLMEAFEADELDAGTPNSQVTFETSDVLVTNGGTPDATGIQDDSGDDSSDSEDEDEDEYAEGDGNGSIDEDEKKRLAHLQGAREDILEIEKQIVSQQNQLSQQANPILRRRILENIKRFKAELELKVSALGEGDEES